jgi:hypothetical protein
MESSYCRETFDKENNASPSKLWCRTQLLLMFLFNCQYVHKEERTT